LFIFAYFEKPKKTTTKLPKKLPKNKKTEAPPFFSFFLFFLLVVVWTKWAGVCDNEDFEDMTSGDVCIWNDNAESDDNDDSDVVGRSVGTRSTTGSRLLILALILVVRMVGLNDRTMILIMAVWSPAMVDPSSSTGSHAWDGFSLLTFSELETIHFAQTSKPLSRRNAHRGDESLQYGQRLPRFGQRHFPQ